MQSQQWLILSDWHLLSLAFRRARHPDTTLSRFASPNLVDVFELCLG